MENQNRYLGNSNTYQDVPDRSDMQYSMYLVKKVIMLHSKHMSKDVYVCAYYFIEKDFHHVSILG